MASLNNPFRLFHVTRAGKILESFHANQVVHAIAEHKCITVTYKVAGVTSVGIIETTIIQMMKDHPELFTQISRGELVATANIVNVLGGPCPSTGHHCHRVIVKDMPLPLMCSRRHGMVVNKWFKEKKQCPFA